MQRFPHCARRSRRPTSLASILLPAVIVILPGSADATTYTWDCVDDYWQSTSCWSPNGTPTSDDSVYVYPDASANTVLRIDAGTGTAYADTLTIDSLTAYTVSLQQTGGTNTVTNDLILGEHTTCDGAYDLSGSGSLAATNEYIGWAGAGTFTQTGGTNTVGSNLSLGFGS